MYNSLSIQLPTTEADGKGFQNNKHGKTIMLSAYLKTNGFVFGNIIMRNNIAIQQLKKKDTRTSVSSQIYYILETSRQLHIIYIYIETLQFET